MCRERDVNGHRAAVQLPAVVAMREIRRRSRRGDEEGTVVVEDEQDEELEDAFLRYRAREKTTLAGVPAKRQRAKKARTRDEAGENGNNTSTGGKAAGRRPAASKHGFRGVHRRTYGRWSAEIRDNIKGCRVWIGTYDTAEAAARAYDAKARKIYGCNAKTNFVPAAEQEEAKKKSPEVPAPAEAVASVAGGPAGELGPVLAALEITDGWEFETYSRGVLLGGAEQLVVDYVDEPDDELLLGGATASNAGGSCLWSFF
ncbi:hypothetical protein ABZP36_035048 [Zizania latifolia]